MDTARSAAQPAPPLLRLAQDLDRWGTLFLRVAQSKEVPVVEQVLGGLVGWMGSDLLDGWLRLPIPLFDEVSGVSEELFQACQSYLAWLRQAPRPLPAEGRRTHEDLVRSVLDRVHALAARAGGVPGGGGRQRLRGGRREARLRAGLGSVWMAIRDLIFAQFGLEPMMDVRRWIMRRIWGRGRSVSYIFIHPTCGQDDVEAGYLPEWGHPKFLCRRCGVAFDEARVRLGWSGEKAPAKG